MYTKGLSQSDLARKAGVSRQAVSLWFRDTGCETGLRVSTLKTLARNLEVSMELLLTEEISKELLDIAEQEQVALNWDRLYSDREALAVALANKDLRAIARLVQVYGMYAAAKVVGRIVWDKFAKYKPLMLPARQKQCEIIWNLQTSRTSA